LTGKVSVPAEARPFIPEVSRLKTEAQGNKANKIEAEAEK
jgi:hypothetical protein